MPLKPVCNMEDSMSDDDEALSGAIDPVRPWTIRAVSVEARDMAIGAARKDQVGVGQWLEKRIKEWCSAPVQHDGNMIQVASQPRTKAERLDRIAATLATLAAAGVPIDPDHASRVTDALTASLRPKRIE
jgi:hypothetical protein